MCYLEPRKNQVCFDLYETKKKQVLFADSPREVTWANKYTYLQIIIQVKSDERKRRFKCLHLILYKCTN